MEQTKQYDFPIVLISLFNLDFGLKSISSFLQAAGYPTYIVRFSRLVVPYARLNANYFVNPLTKHKVCDSRDLAALMKLIAKLKPRLIGLGVTSVSMQTAIVITQAIRQQFNIPVVWGGIHAIIMPQECMRYCDIVCTGEGEYPTRELADKLRKKEPLTQIRNLWIRQVDSKVEKNPRRPLIENLDSLPFADSYNTHNKFLIDAGKIRKKDYVDSSGALGFYPIMTTRGCMYKCSFCCNSIIREKYKGKGHYLRRRSVENVISELEAANQAQEIGVIRFWDDVFIFDRRWIEEFIAVYRRRIRRPFICYTHPRFADRKLIKELADAGLSVVTVGIQTVDPVVGRDIMGRIQDNRKILEHAYLLRQHSVLPRFDLIADNPYEDDTANAKAVDFLLQLPRPFLINFYSLCYYPRTPLTERALADGVIGEKDLEQYSSKSLNNFFMFLPLSKNKKELFWNCLKAMAVVDYLPRSLVKFCKKGCFLRRHPYFLYSVISVYMHCLLFLKKNLFRQKSIKKSYINGISFFQKFPPECWAWLPRRKLLNVTPFYKFIVFAQGEGFCLKIVKRIDFRLPLKFSLSLFPFNRDKRVKRYLWKMKLVHNFSKAKEISFKLDNFNLYFYEDQQIKKARLTEKAANKDLFLDNRNIMEIKYKVPCFGYLPVAYLLIYPGRKQ